jgi:asparagine synthase (glutamine-hydrolysing)
VSGVCGVVWWGGGVEVGVVEAMVGAAPWRAADGSATWVGEGAGLGFGRLEVTPEDEVERQPFDDGSVVVVADCRLDDRGPLIQMLADQGPWRWATPTDVELIARAYHRWGESFAGHLLGDFAVAVWDRTRRRLVCARDPMGMRPLYYWTDPHRIVFASEIKQILTHPDVPRRIHEPFVAAHLAGIYGPIEWTAYQGITQLAPSTTLVHDGTTAHTSTHWRPDPHHRIDLDTHTDYATALRHTLTQAVRDRLRTARPPALLLSGGMDSGSIASVAGWLHHHEPTLPLLHTYSWAFTELPQCDERHISRHITDHYHLPATDIPADHLWPLAHYPDHTPDPDEPFIGVYQPLIDHTLTTITRITTNPPATRPPTTRLVLGGDRGDLVLGPAFDLVELVRAGMSREAVRAVGDLARLGAPMEALGAAGRAVRSGLGDALRGRRPSPTPEVPPWVRPAFIDSGGLDGGRPAIGPPGPFTDARSLRHALVFTPHHMRGVIWSDRTYARHGAAFADPYSDRRIAELVLAVPPVLTSRRGKQLLRASMEGVMPEAARTSATKTLPTPLYHRGLRQAGHPVVDDLLDDPESGRLGWVEAAAARDAYARYRAGGRDEPLLFRLISLEMWLRAYWA